MYCFGTARRGHTGRTLSFARRPAASSYPGETRRHAGQGRHAVSALCRRSKYASSRRVRSTRCTSAPRRRRATLLHGLRNVIVFSRRPPCSSGGNFSYTIRVARSGKYRPPVPHRAEPERKIEWCPERSYYKVRIHVKGGDGGVVAGMSFRRRRAHVPKGGPERRRTAGHGGKTWGWGRPMAGLSSAHSSTAFKAATSRPSARHRTARAGRMSMAPPARTL